MAIHPLSPSHTTNVKPEIELDRGLRTVDVHNAKRLLIRKSGDEEKASHLFAMEIMKRSSRVNCLLKKIRLDGVRSFFKTINYSS